MVATIAAGDLVANRIAILRSGTVTTANVTTELTSLTKLASVMKFANVKESESLLGIASVIEYSENLSVEIHYIFVVYSGSAHHNADTWIVIKSQPVLT